MIKKYEQITHINLIAISLLLMRLNKKLPLVLLKATFICQLRDSNPRPFRMVPETIALDRSAKLTLIDFGVLFL